MDVPRPVTGYLVDIVTRERLEFQYNPEEITDEKASNYASIIVPGMSHPRHQYIAGDARRIVFILSLFKGDVQLQVRWLQSLCYPEQEKTMLLNAPHKVLFFFGDLYQGVICIVRSVRVRYFGMFAAENLAPQRAYVEITLEEIVTESVDYRSIRK